MIISQPSRTPSLTADNPRVKTIKWYSTGHGMKFELDGTSNIFVSIAEVRLF